MERSIWSCVLCLVATAAAVAQPPDGDRYDSRGRNAAQQDNFQQPDSAGGPGGFRGFGRFGPPNLMFQAIDADGDGVLTSRELRRAAGALKKLDANRDGNLTLDEVSPPNPFGDPEQFADRTLRDNDKNGDGRLTPDEVPDPLAQMLQGADQNGDGAIDRDELVAAVQNMRNRFRRGFRGRGNFDATQWVGQMMQGDRNGDGRLTPNEVPQQSLGMLRGADQNHDGAIDSAELQAVAQRMSERFGRGRRFRPPAGDESQEELPDFPP